MSRLSENKVGAFKKHFSPQRLSLDRPLLISICKDNQFNYTRANSLGYTLQRQFVSGETRNNTVLSWMGEAGNRSWNETVSFIYQVTEGTHLYFPPNLPGSFTGNVTARFLLPYGLCETFHAKMPGFVEIKPKDTDRFSYNIFISDPAATTKFQLPYSLISGDKILTRHGKIGLWSAYKIKVTEKIVETDDGTCIKYPNNKHNSYSDCIESELHDKILPTYGCMPPWMSDMIACSKPIPRHAEQVPLMQWFYIISQDSWGDIEYQSDTCLPSCNLMSFQAGFKLKNGSLKAHI